MTRLNDSDLPLSLLEPLIDLGVLAAAKALSRYSQGPLFNVRLHQPA